MRVVCAWCGAVMREACVHSAGEVSHGMCFGCRIEMFQEYPVELAALRRNEHPVRHDCPLWGMWIDLGAGG